MTGPQTPGSAESPPAAGPGPRVPAAARGVAAAAGDPATVSRTIADDLRRRGFPGIADYLNEQERDITALHERLGEAHASLAAALAAIARVRNWAYGPLPDGRFWPGNSGDTYREAQTDARLVIAYSETSSGGTCSCVDKPPCICGPDATGEDIDEQPDCPAHQACPPHSHVEEAPF